MAVATPAVPASGTAVVNTTGQAASVTVTGGTITGILVAPFPVQPALTAPAVPLTTVAQANASAFPVAVTVTGGTVTVISVNGVASGLTSGIVVVPAGGTVAITYSVAPTWTWAPLLAGLSGTSIPTPSSVPLLQNAQVTLVYSVAPTWAWTDPLDMEPIGYAAENQAAISEISQLPLPAHTEGGETGLGDAVSN
jgi:hypothetical protein